MGRRALTAIAVTMAAIAMPGIASARTVTVSNESGDGVVLEQVLGQRTRPLFAATRTDGSGFGRLHAVTPPTDFGGQSLGVDDAGGAVVAWSQRRHPHYGGEDVMVATKPAGKGFSEPRQLGFARQIKDVQVAVSRRGEAIVAWTNYAGATHYAIRQAGVSFAPATRLPETKGPVELVLDDDGGLFVLFDGGTKTRRLLTEHKPPGGSFGPPSEVDAQAPEEGLYDVSVGRDRTGRALFAWRAGSTILAAERMSGSASLDPPQTVASGLEERDALDAVALSASGRAAIAYGPAPVTIVLREGGVWSDPAQLPMSAQRLFEVRLAYDDRGDLAIVWAPVDHSVHTTYRAAGGSFEPPHRLARPRPFAPGFGFDVPSLTIDGSGRASAVWEQSNGAHVSLYSRDFGAGGVHARRRIARLRSFRREGPASGCLTGGKVVRRTRRASVVRDRHGDLYACLFARGAFVSLYADEGIFPPIELAGPFAAYAGNYCDLDSCFTLIDVEDLRDETFGVVGGAVIPPAEVPAIRLKPNGAVAWVSCRPSEVEALGTIHRCKKGTHARKRVYAFDRHARKPRLLDVSRRIYPLSLALHGSRLTWRDGRKLRSARLR